jgi:hypothetical protein
LTGIILMKKNAIIGALLILTLGPVAGARAGGIAGTITGPDQITPLTNIYVTAYTWNSAYWDWAGSINTNANGHYEIAGLTTGTYRVQFSDGSGNYLGETYNNAPDLDSGADIVVSAGATVTNINASLALASKIAGTVTGPDQVTPLMNICVAAYTWDGSNWSGAGNANTDAGGRYTVGGLTAGTYRVQFSDGSGNYLGETYNNTSNLDSGANIVVPAGATVTNVNASLASASRIAGTVTAPNQVTPLTNIYVAAYTWNGSYWDFGGSANTDTNGHYEIAGLAAGTYRAEFSDLRDVYAGEIYSNAPDLNSGANIIVPADAAVTNINASLALAAKIAGTVTGLLPNIYVAAYTWNGLYWDWQGSANTDTNGHYQIGGLAAGTSRIEFSDVNGVYARQTYNNASNLDSGANITLTTGAPVSGINATLASASKISGTVTRTGDAAPLPNIFVEAYTWNGLYWDWSGSTNSDGNGYYEIGGLAAGTYHVTFSDWSDVYANSSSNVVVPASATVSGVNASLVSASKIAGTVTRTSDAAPLANIIAQTFTWSGSLWTWQGSANTDANGHYQIGGLAAGTNRIEFSDVSGVYASKTYSNAPSLDSGTDVVVPAGATVAGIDVKMATNSGPFAPAITSSMTASATTGQLFSYTITASGTPPIAYGATGFPAGLTLVGAIISGTPTAVGTNSITLTASNATGASANTLVLKILAPNHAPTISSLDPASPAALAEGGTQVFAVTASDQDADSLTYTWSLDGRTIPGVTNASYVYLGYSHPGYSVAGTHAIQVLVSDGRGGAVMQSWSLAVNLIFTGIQVTPASVIVATNGTRQFTALATDQFGAALVNQPGFTWSVTGGGTISTIGLFTAGSTTGGPYTVTANGGGKSGTARVTVTLGGVRNMKISFPGYSRSTTLTNFPTLVKFSTGMTNGFAYSQMRLPIPYDLRFRDATETQELNYEIESWNTNGESFVWVQVPALSNGASIWAYWGDSSLVSAPAYTTNGATWNANYRGVWHLPNGTTLTASDSTANRYNGTISGVTATSGTIDGAASFDGTSSKITFSLPSVTTLNTISMWIYPVPSSDNYAALLTENSACGVWYRGASHKVEFYTSGYPHDNNTALTENTWNYVVLANNSGTLTFYVNGSADGVVAGGIPAFVPNTMGDDPSSETYKGKIDEVRISTVARSADWIWAEWMNMASNGVFCEMGTVENASPAGMTIHGIPYAWLASYGITNTSDSVETQHVAGSSFNVLQDYIAGMNPTNPNSCFSVSITNSAGQIIVSVPSIQAAGSNYTGQTRYYDVEIRTSLLSGAWQLVSGYTGILGNGNIITCTNAIEDPTMFYRAKVWLQ